VIAAAVFYRVTSGASRTAATESWFKPFKRFNRCAPFNA